MKISIVVGGRWHAFDLARELHREGVLHRLVTNYPKFKMRNWQIPDEKVVSLPSSLLLGKLLYGLGGERLFSKFQYLQHHLFGTAAAKHLNGSDVVHGWSSFSLPSLLRARRSATPFVLERSSAHMRVQCRLLREEYEMLGLHWAATHPKVVAQELREYDLANCIAVPSIFVKSTFIAEGFPENRLFHNPFGTNLSSFSPGKKSDDVFRAIYAGSLSVRKGIHYLTDAFKSADLPNSELVLVGGKTPETGRLLGRADHRIKIAGRIPQNKLAGYYHESSVFVMSSIEEGLALVQAQAMACGLPLICTRNTGGEDLLRMDGSRPIAQEGGIEEYAAGYLVQARDSNAIAACLKVLAKDKDLLRRKSEAALQLRGAGLDWCAYAKRALELYEHCLAPSG